MAKTTIPAGYFAAGSIATADLADDAITSAKIADNAITAAMVPNATALTLDGGLTVDNITINGTEIDLSSGDLTVDVAGNLILAPGTDEVRLVGGSNDTAFGKFYASSGNFFINMPTQDKDIIFSGNDGGSSISPMIIDMSAGGKVGIGTATPTHGLTVSDEILDDSSSRRITIKSTNHGANAGYRFTTESADGSTRSGGLYFKPENTADNSYLSLSADDSSGQLVVRAGGNVGIGNEAPDTLLHLTKASENADVDFIKMQMSGWAGSSGQVKNIAWSDGTNVCAIGPEFTTNKVNMHFHSFYNGGYKTETTKLFTINGDGNIDAPNGDITADNIYAGASGQETQIVNFPCTSTYPNGSTYSFTLTASQAPLGSYVILGTRVSSGNSGGDQYIHVVQSNAHGPGLYSYVGTWYYNSGAASVYKVDVAGDRTFNVTHGTIVATNSNDFRRVYYYGYFMDN